jgi:hypothetical protein
MRLHHARTRRVRVSLLSAVIGVTTLVPAAGAGEPAVAVGEVHASLPLGEFAGPLKNALLDAMTRVELGSAREKFVLSATLESLAAERVGRGARASAVVSLVLRSARRQTLHAVLTGRATAEAPDSSVSELRDDALRAAVRSALRRLPEALR